MTVFSSPLHTIIVRMLDLVDVISQLCIEKFIFTTFILLSLRQTVTKNSFVLKRATMKKAYLQDYFKQNIIIVIKNM